ncbi:mitochondrial genome maintenance MGM101-domain-containing protein [Umbelopsis sp. AD052]|nr:mitochondrial genome maintenance MGM101-domain-containing protein [Umbelopsis sp. AD052]
MLRVSLGAMSRISSAGRAAVKIQSTTIRAVSTTETISAKRFSPTRRDQSTVKATTKAKDVVESQEVVSGTNAPTDGRAYFPATQEFDAPAVEEGIELNEQSNTHDWSKSFHGLSTQPFSSEVAEVLMQPIAADDIEIKPDGLLYLPEIKYRRILNKAFGPGGWGLAPRGEHSISPKNVSREYALICHGRFVSQARGEQDFFDNSGLPTASEGCKSNALMRCCKDLGIASELWDPGFIRKFKKKHCVEVWAEHLATKKKKKLWRRKDGDIEYPYKET